jgi:hypothetical protein
VLHTCLLQYLVSVKLQACMRSLVSEVTWLLLLLWPLQLGNKWCCMVLNPYMCRVADVCEVCACGCLVVCRELWSEGHVRACCWLKLFLCCLVEAGEGCVFTSH